MHRAGIELSMQLLRNFIESCVSRPEMKNCFNQILICLNLMDSLHIIFAILDGVRNNFELYYPIFLMRVFPHFHYPFYR